MYMKRNRLYSMMPVIVFGVLAGISRLAFASLTLRKTSKGPQNTF